MPILSIEKRILKPTFGYENFESPIPGENYFGEELASAQFTGLITVLQNRPGLHYRRVANIEFPNPEVANIWGDAENEALGKVSQHRNFVYRLRPDEGGIVEVFLYNTQLFQTLYPGMSGIMIGEIANSSVANT